MYINFNMGTTCRLYIVLRDYTNFKGTSREIMNNTETSLKVIKFLKDNFDKNWELTLRFLRPLKQIG